MFHAVRVALQRLSTLTVVSVITLSSLATATPLFFGASSSALGEVLINEISPATGGSTTKWVELYNPGDAAINMSGWRLTRGGAGNTWGTVFPDTANISAHGYYVVSSTSSLPLTAGSDLVLRTGPASTGVDVDTANYVNLAEGQTYGRSPDGSSSWATFSAAQVTKNAANYVESTKSPVVPGLLTLTSPANGASLTIAPTTFSWVAATDAVGYEIEFSTSNTFGTGIGFTSDTTSLTTADAVTADGTYYWRVRGVSSTSHTGAWATGTFTVTAPVNQAPSVPVLASPVNGVVRYSSDDNYSTWAASTDPDGDGVTYVYESSFVSDFSNIALESSTGSDTQIQNGLEPEGVYYWHVKAVDEHGLASDWSETRSIVIDNTAPGRFDLLTPEDGATLTSSSFDKFDWDDATDDNGITYSIAFYRDDDLLSSTSDLTTSEWTPALSLEEGIYDWIVWATDAAGNETSTEVWTFVIDNGEPTPGEEEEESTPPIEEPVSPPVITAVLAVAQLITGANDGSRALASNSNASNNGESDGDVKAAETTSEDNAIDGAVEENEQKLVEDAGSVFEYWWVVLLTLLGLFWLIAAKRRKNEK